MNGDIILNGLNGFLLILACGLLLFFMVEAFTIEESGTMQVKCVDGYDRPFEDEWCEKKLTCSWLGFASTNGRCANQEEKDGLTN